MTAKLRRNKTVCLNDIIKLFRLLTVALLIAGKVHSQSPFVGGNAGHEVQAKEDELKKVTDPKLKAQAQQWMSVQQSTGFLENKGQMMDSEGKPVPFILFTTEAPGVNMYVTEQGLSYMFMKPDTSSKKSLVREAKENNTGNSIEHELLKKMGGHIRYECLRVDMSLTRASIKKENIITEGASDRVKNYYTGQNAEGVLDVHTYKKITIKEIYPGIDWVLYNSDTKGFKYDFIVHPGANPKQIKLLYRSEKELDIDREGNINIKTHLGTLTENTPLCYMDKTRENIRAKFIRTYASSEKKQQESEISFSLDQYDNSKTLVIDPQLWWRTYFYDMTGGNGSSVNPVTVDCDANGYVYVSGQTLGSLPLMPWGSAYYSAAMRQLFVARFTNKGVLTWSTYYGAASNTTSPNFLTIDKADNIYITGYTADAIPVQSWGSAYYNPTFNPAGMAGIGLDAIILRFSNTGTLIWATHFGGNNWENGTSLNIAQNGNIYMTGWTSSSDFPTRAWGASYYDNSYNGAQDAFVAGFDNAGQLLWSTYLGGSADDEGTGITTDASGNIYVTGPTASANFPTQSLAGAYNDNSYNGGNFDIFIAKFTNTGLLQWSTFFGGSGIESGNGTPGISLIGIDFNNNIYVTGSTTSTNFPLQTWGTAYYDGTLAGLFDMFITRFNSSCALTWSTYYGGAGIPTPPNVGIDEDEQHMVCDEMEFDNCGNLYLAFRTESADITTYNPGCGSYCDNTWGGGYGWKHSEELPGDVIITKFSTRTGHLLWSTFIGSTGDDYRGALAVDPYNNLFVVGVFWEYASGTATGLPFVDPGGGAFFNNRSFGGATFNTGYTQGYILKFIPDPPPIFTQSQVNAGSCLCNATATVNISASCSVAPYNYIWSNGTQVLNTNSNTNTNAALCPGSYWVEVTDDVCNRDTVYYTITTPAGNLSATGTQTNISCNGGSTGTATVLPTGGTPSYNYSWSNGKTSAGVTGLTAGNYNVIIKDANGCTYQQSFVITQPTQLITNFSGFTQTSACKNTGTATVSANGGTAPYVYNWGGAAGGQTGTTATGLGVGNYTVTVSDANGCSSTQIAPVTAIAPLSYTLTPNNSTCGTGAYITAAATGGTGPYTFHFSSGKTISTSGTAGDGPLATGTYSVTITDADGCSGTQTVSVTSTSQNAVTATYTRSPAGVVCAGTPVVFTNTGTTTGTYSWGVAQNSTTIASGTTVDFSYTFLTAGSYTVVHTVSNSFCSTPVSENIQVINCSASPSVIATGNTTCPGVCTTVTSSAGGGTSPYIYSWSTGATTQDISPCPATTTTYTVKITDAGGITATSSATVTVNPAISVTATPILNCGTNSGSVTATVTGGTSGFTYSWSNGITTVTSGSSQISNLPSNTYSVTVTDAKGCSATSSAVIDPPFAAQYIKGTINCAGCGCKEWIMVTPLNGRAPYTYIWPALGGYDKRYLNTLCPGTYAIKVTDKNGCNVNLSITTP
jgi:hypothetical protein